MISYAITLSLVLVLVSGCGDYYWRDYDGDIPSDAIPAGTGENNEVFYIGHAILHGFGVSVGTIRKGKREVTVACYGVRRTTKRVQILCAQNHTKYYWSTTTSDDVKDLVKDKCPVVGGWDTKAATERSLSLGTLYVGRKRYHDELILGSIAFYALEERRTPPMYLPYDGEERSTTEYQILMYTPSPSANYNGVETVFNLDVINVEH